MSESAQWLPRPSDPPREQPVTPLMQQQWAARAVPTQPPYDPFSAVR